MAVVFVFSSISNLGAAARVPDWISHPIEYGVGAVLLCRALAGARPGPFRLSTALTATLLATASGVTDEYHQSFVPGRTSDFADVVKDLAGAAAGSLIYRHRLHGRGTT
jgi:VanZ family protein